MGHIAIDPDLVIDGGRVRGALDEVARTVVRDLSVSCALITSNVGHGRRLLASAGSEPLRHLRALNGTTFPRDAFSMQVPVPVPGHGSTIVSPYAAVRILSADEAVATGSVTTVLWAISDVRRWFDRDEFHHLRLLACRAEAVLATEPPIALGVETVDARPHHDRRIADLPSLR